MTSSLGSRFVLLPLVLVFLIATPFPLQGQTGSADAATVQLNHITSFSALPNGIDLRDGEARMQIVALREDVVRIRGSRTPGLPEDTSWAVFKEARQSSVAVTPDDTANCSWLSHAGSPRLH
jgi:alpha-glucosidase